MPEVTLDERLRAGIEQALQGSLQLRVGHIARTNI
jgi:hypothetical protein